MSSPSGAFNRPKAYQTTDNVVIPDSMLDESFRGEYDGDNNLIFKGFARPGADEGLLIWQIAILAYDVNGNVLSIKWPLNSSGVASNDYLFSWTARAGYTYA